MGQIFWTASSAFHDPPKRIRPNDGNQISVHTLNGSLVGVLILIALGVPAVIRLCRLALCLPVFALAISSPGTDRALACELCRRYGTTAFHVDGLDHDHTIGGDAFNDALSEPPKPEGDDEGGSGGFVVQGGKWPQQGGSGAPFTLTYSFQNMFDGGLLMPNGQPLPNDLIRDSIEEALGLWASVVPVHYVEVPDNGLAYGIAGAQFGQIRFRHVFINGPDPPPPQDPIAKAQAYFPDLRR